jgi:hypothetical protein
MEHFTQGEDSKCGSRCSENNIGLSKFYGELGSCLPIGCYEIEFGG